MTIGKMLLDIPFLWLYRLISGSICALHYYITVPLLQHHTSWFIPSKKVKLLKVIPIKQGKPEK